MIEEEVNMYVINNPTGIFVYLYICTLRDIFTVFINDYYYCIKT